MRGREFFAQHSGSPAKIAALTELPETVQLAWESESVSEHSPGPVKNDENLCRPMVQPVHVKNGNVDPTAFNDAGTRGLSVNRLSLLSLGAILQLGRERADHQNARRGPTAGSMRRLVGYTSFSVNALRELVYPRDEQSESSRRSFDVYDTATAVDKTHADVCILVPGKQAERSLRLDLYRLGNASYVSIA